MERMPTILSMLPSYTGRRLWVWARMNASISSGESSISSAARSTREVSMLSTVVSPNCRAEDMSSPRSSSRLPSSVISSMMSYISSSVTEISGSALTNFAAKLPVADSSFASGFKTDIKKHSEPATANDSRSLYFFAMLLGSISPAKKTTMVITKVLTVTAPGTSGNILVTASVTMLAAEICTIFVQISMLVMARSKLSRTCMALTALGSPRSARILIFTLDTEAKAVSATAKYAAQSKSKTTIVSDNRLASSISDLTRSSIQIRI